MAEELTPQLQRCPECGWLGTTTPEHLCDPEGGRTGNQFSTKPLVTRTELIGLIALALAPVLALVITVGINAPTYNYGEEATDDSYSETSSRVLTTEEDDEGFFYDDTMEFGYRFLKSKEEKKHTCHGDCIVVKVVALRDCKYVYAKGEVRKSDNVESKVVSTAGGWVRGKKSKSAMSMDDIRYVTLKAKKNLGNSTYWYWITDITCTPTD